MILTGKNINCNRLISSAVNVYIIRLIKMEITKYIKRITKNDLYLNTTFVRVLC